jgi:hypothetical protein
MHKNFVSRSHAQSFRGAPDTPDLAREQNRHGHIYIYIYGRVRFGFVQIPIRKKTVTLQKKALLPASQPNSQPASQTASQPASEPA